MLKSSSLMIAAILSTLTIFSGSTKAETVTINAEDDWAPYSSVKADKTGVEGFTPEIVKEAFKSQGVEVVFKAVPYARCLDEVEKGIEVACFDTLIDNDNKNKFLFHKTPIFEVEMGIWGPEASTDSNLTMKDLEGKLVGVTNGYTYSSTFTDNKKIKKEVTPSEETQFKKLAIGRLQYAVVFTMPGYSILKRNVDLNGKIKKIGSVSKDPVYLNFSKTHKDGQRLVDVFEKGMQAIKVNGTYKKLEDDFNKKVGL